jgi:hypothetical protein
VVTINHLASVLRHHDIFDHAVITALSPDYGDRADLVQRIHGALKPDAALVIAVPFGLSRADGHALYPSSLRRLVEPAFDVTKIELIGDSIALVASRRDHLTGTPVWAPDETEQAFAAHEKRLTEKVQDLSSQLIQSGARYRGAIARSERLKLDLERVNRDYARLRGRLRRLRPLYRVPLAIYRKLKRLRASRNRQPAFAPVTNAAPATTTAPPQPAAKNSVAMSWQDELRRAFSQWLKAAATAEGDEVVLMFSGTTFVQEHRANRPIRLTKIYLERKCPVFFNYYRWNDKEELPSHPDPLLFQSPIDATPKLLDALLTADFGGKKKIFFASFPHEIMVRYLTLAAQHGWVTVYDARDDWEEFAKVGMAKWYHPGYERYVAAHADIVSAVSRPLARKISALADRPVHVSANALDPEFPRPSGPRIPGKSPVAGYFGHLTDKWFDWPLVIAAAERYPEITFELAGHQGPKLDLPSNIKLLGMMGHKDLAERSRGWSLALIPFKNSALADAVDPIKIYEYLHLRLPVLCTYFPQCRDYPGTTVTEGREEFIRLIPELAGTSVPEEVVSEWLSRNTWEQRVTRYSQLADAIRNRGRRGLPALLEGK